MAANFSKARQWNEAVFGRLTPGDLVVGTSSDACFQMPLVRLQVGFYADGIESQDVRKNSVLASRKRGGLTEKLKDVLNAILQVREIPV